VDATLRLPGILSSGHLPDGDGLKVPHLSMVHQKPSQTFIDEYD
jgi:hypothetical protein